MTDDIVAQLRAMPRCLDDAMRKMDRAADEIDRLRLYGTGDWASQRENDALTIEKYEWKGRAEAAESELSTLRARVREVVGSFASADLADCKDCVDNDGKHYQSRWLADALRAAKQLVEEVK